MDHLKDIRDKTAYLGQFVEKNFEKHIKNNEKLQKVVGDLSTAVDDKLSILKSPTSSPIITPEGELHDDYGMPLKREDFEEYYKAAQTYNRKMKKQSQRIKAILSSSFSDNSVFATIVAGGLPSEHRAHLWMLFTKKDIRMRKNLNLYKNLIAAEETFAASSTAVQQIDKDITRTFPGYTGPDFRGKLRRVLCAYAAYNPRVGYCQAMNFLAGGLLIFADEEYSFWLLVHIVDEMLPDYFTESMTGCIVDSAVLDELLAERLPQLHTHMVRDCGMSIQLVATQWFMCLFLNTLPPITAFQVWDLLFFYGAKVLFELSLTIFKMTQKFLLTQRDPVEMIWHLHHYCSRVYDSSSLFREVQLLSLSQIDTIRASQRTRVAEEAVHREEMRAIAKLERTTQFGVKELKELHNKFEEMSVSTDMDIDFDIFCGLLHAVLPNLATKVKVEQDISSSGEEEVTFSKKLFDVFDVDKDGVVKPKELMCGLSVLCKGTVNDKLAMCFGLFSDSDGLMGKQQLSTLLGALYSMYFQQGFQKEVTFFVDMIFQEADKNADGNLSLEEFMKAASTQPFIMKCFRVDDPDDSVFHIVKQQNQPKKKEDDLLKDPEEWVVM